MIGHGPTSEDFPFHEPGSDSPDVGSHPSGGSGEVGHPRFEEWLYRPSRDAAEIPVNDDESAG